MTSPKKKAAQKVENAPSAGEVLDSPIVSTFKETFGPDHVFTGCEADMRDERVIADFVPIIKAQIEQHIMSHHDFLGDYLVCQDGGNVEVRKWVWDVSTSKKVAPKRRLQSFPKHSDLALFFENNPVWWPEEKQVKGRAWVEWKEVNPFKIWVRSKLRPTYTSVTYAPVKYGETPNIGEKTLNLYQGWPLEPDFEGAIEKTKLIRNHILYVICEGDVNFYQWIISWFAHKIQYPQEKIGTAIALRSGQGIGKGSIITNVFGRILGQHFKHLININMVTGRFNAGFEDASVVYLDEAFFTKDVEAASRLKGLITEQELTQERKYKDPTSKAVVFDIIIATNLEQAAPVEADDRRYTIADIETKPQSEEYFIALHEEIANGGTEAFFAFLLEWDLTESRVDVTRPYETKGRMKQKLQNLKHAESWWYDVLRNGSFGQLKANGHAVDWAEYVGSDIPKGLLVTACIEYHNRMRATHIPKSKSITTNAQKWCPSLSLQGPSNPRKFTELCFQNLEGGDRQRSFVLPPLEAARKDFEVFMGGEIDWDEDPTASELQVDFEASWASAPEKPANMDRKDKDNAPF